MIVVVIPSRVHRLLFEDSCMLCIRFEDEKLQVTALMQVRNKELMTKE